MEVEPSETRKKVLERYPEPNRLSAILGNFWLLKDVVLYQTIRGLKLSKAWVLVHVNGPNVETLTFIEKDQIAPTLVQVSHVGCPKNYVVMLRSSKLRPLRTGSLPVLRKWLFFFKVRFWSDFDQIYMILCHMIRHRWPLLTSRGQYIVFMCRHTSVNFPADIHLGR